MKLKSFSQIQTEKILSFALAFLVCFGFLFLMFRSFVHFEIQIPHSLNIHFVSSNLNSSLSEVTKAHKTAQFHQKKVAQESNVVNQTKSEHQNIHLHDSLDTTSELQSSAGSQSQNFQGQTKDNLVIFSPLPQIPYDLRREAFECDAQAKFTIANDGGVAAVNLVKLCQNPKLNSLLLRSLKQWKFKPEAASTTRNIKVKFIVE